MANYDMIPDDYVADLLAKEANECSLKYSSMGLEAFNTKKKPANMPKPNTRFLRHIIKDTDTHNKNLLAKEAADSQARLKVLENAEEKERRKHAGPQDIRKRQMGDIKAILGGRTQRSTRTDERSHKKDASSPRQRHRDRRSESPERGHRRHHRRRDDSDSEREDRRRHKSGRRRSRSPDDGSRRHRHRSPVGRDSTSRSHRSDKERRDYDDEDLMSKGRRARTDRSRETQGFSIKGSSSRRAAQEHDSAAASDSDPLDDIIGPAPPAPVRSRGRGAASASSGIDKRFEADYDPKMDVEMESGAAGDAENWDDAVEAFRDRQKWRQNQEQRMRAAGYDEEMIKKWKTGEQKDEKDVRWAKAGEKREWDRGKEGGMSGLFSEFN
ncbi:pre-mRNA-splicing factor 38B [Colletotrichum karsti]|uniref:Pre-mRNA-splicing factor 38B n=1 Tax=Colletotrichum karsti TaxID=1095194 RepID=A0A9P6I4P5_9PEZI|nr:pre-mRNA-splicing factor 38B [Colletotrichum karsti]KAF9871915.1 pre-mRNA-splicing factor 38B [Colletotrichum karsti]